MTINRIINVCKLFKEKFGTKNILNIGLEKGYIVIHYIDDNEYVQTFKAKGE